MKHKLENLRITFAASLKPVRRDYTSILPATIQQWFPMTGGSFDLLSIGRYSSLGLQSYTRLHDGGFFPKDSIVLLVGFHSSQENHGSEFRNHCHTDMYCKWLTADFSIIYTTELNLLIWGFQDYLARRLHEWYNLLYNVLLQMCNTHILAASLRHFALAIFIAQATSSWHTENALTFSVLADICETDTNCLPYLHSWTHFTLLTKAS